MQAVSRPDSIVEVQKKIIGRGCFSVVIRGERAEKMRAQKLATASTRVAFFTSKILRQATKERLKQAEEPILATKNSTGKLIDSW